MDIRKKFFTKRVVSHNIFLREVAMAPCLTEFKEHQGDALKTPGLVLDNPVRSRELDSTTFVGTPAGNIL